MAMTAQWKGPLVSHVSGPKVAETRGYQVLLVQLYISSNGGLVGADQSH